MGGESAENCMDAECSWESTTATDGVCKKKLSDIDSQSNYECVPIDAANVDESEGGGNIQFSTKAPATTLDPEGCCLIKPLFGGSLADFRCEDDYTKFQCDDYAQQALLAGNFESTVLFPAEACQDVVVTGLKGCPQGRTTVYVDTTKTTVKPTTKPYTLAPTDYRIFVNLQNKKGLQVSLNPTQSAITASKLVPIFQELLKLPTAIKYDAATTGGKMFFFRAGGLEIRFPKTLEDQHRPDAKVVRARVRKMNEDAGGGDRRRRGVNGAKIAYLDVTLASGQSKKDLVFVAGASDYYYDAADTSNQPTAPVPTKPVVVVTTRPLVAKKTVPTITRTRTTKTTTTAKWMRQETKTYTTTTETVTSTTYTGTTIAPTTTTRTIDRSNADSIGDFIGLGSEGVDQSATVAPYVAPKVKTSATTIVIIIVIVMVMVGVGVLVICRMKQKLDVTASDPNYVRGGGAAFGNPAYAPAGGAIDEANEGYLDIQEAARGANKKAKKKKGGLVRQESLC